MDSKPTVPASKKMKFVPKAPSRRPPMPVIPKTEVIDDAESFEAKELMRRFNDGLEGKPKFERKSAPVKVAFGFGSSAMAGNHYKPSSSKNKDAKNPFNIKPEKEYEEPWDYHTNYPVTLPLRIPNSGNPDVLDEKEFETPSESQNIDSNRMNTGLQLGLIRKDEDGKITTDENCEPRLMLIQLPGTVPMMNQEGASSSNPPRKCVSVRDLPAGLLGKLLVYKSGKVKLKLGEMLYNVDPGSNCKFAEDCVAFNMNARHFYNLGTIDKHVVVTPDVDSILDSIESSDADSIIGGLEKANIG